MFKKTLKRHKTIKIMITENDFYTKNRDIDFYNFFEVKAEKLVTAVYMITNFLSDKEPMKWKLRETCLAMLSCSSVLKEKNTQERSDILVRVLSIVGEVLSLLEIARLSSFVSEMNYSILKREYASIKKQIESREEIKNSVANLSFSENFFASPDSRTLPVGAHHKTSGDPTRIKFYNKDNSSAGHVSRSVQNFTKQDKDVDQKDIALRTHQESKNCPKEKTYSVKDKRREVILQILKDKKDLTIKDISLKITDCSEKTIQRELVSMLENGILKRIGERRWSKYSLI